MRLFEFILELIKVPAFILGFIALVGLVLQKKKFSDVLTGTVKTILGLLIMSLGTGGITGALNSIQKMFTTGVPMGNFETIVTFDEGVLGAVQAANVGGIGAEIAWTMLFGYIVHLILARVTKFKYVYLTGHMIWIHAGLFAILFHSFGLSTFWVVLLASIVDGLYMTLAPALAQPFVRKITGNEGVALAHGTTLQLVIGGWIGKFFGKPEDSAENIKVKPGWDFFRDMAMSIASVMLVVTLIAALLAVIQIGAAGFAEEISAGQNWLLYAILQALGFTAGVLVLLQGVRMLISEIVPAFKGIAEKVIPNAVPALDIPVIYSFAPNSLIIGLISGTIGQAVGMILLALLGWPVPLPSMITAFFASGGAAIFGNTTGGRRGAIAAGFSFGIIAWFIRSLAWSLEIFGDLAALGSPSLGFAVGDGIIPSFVIWAIAKLFGA